jgi:serine protease inhibitor
MKILALICFTALLALVKCQTQDPTYGGIFSTSKPYVDPDEYIQPENKQDVFDWKLTKAVLSSQPNNVLISPLSVKILLTLLAEAAGQTVESKTRKELEQVLPYNKNLYDAKEYFKKVLTSINTPDDLYRVNFATKVFVDDIVSINQRFSSIAQHNYNADVENLDFGDSRRSAGVINEWVKQTTNGHISDLVSEDSVSKSIILLINALYFEGTWRFAFNKSLTRDFLHAPGKKSSKQFMEQTSNFYYFFSRHLDAKILRLPYDGRRFSMFIILPNDVNGIDAVVSKLDSNALKNEVWHMDELEVHAIIPKFKFDTSVNLNDITRSLGITEIFENTATFPLLARGGSSEGKLKVSNIIQKSGIVVDEKGTTAWSATEIELVNKFGGDPKEFIADHPFIFYVEDDVTGSKLFAGRVTDPHY